MTRINTNVGSLTAQKTLARTNLQLQEALTRLSTGLRINTGKDDPAGLIASEILRSDIISTQKAVSNSERANQMIATADSALGQVSSLLNDIRGLVEEAANKGALSQEQIEANQLQIDSSLEAIDRIAQTTQFQGRRLLDGSLDFVTENVDSTKMSNLRIDQANFGTSSQISVNVDVVTQATQAALSFRGSQVTSPTVVEIGGFGGFETFNFSAGATVSQIATAINLVSDALGVQASLGQRIAQSATHGQAGFYQIGGSNGFTVTATTEGKYAGNFTIRMTKAAAGGSTSASWSAGSPNVIDVTVGTAAGATAGARAGNFTLGGVGEFKNLTPQLSGAEYNKVSIKVIDTASEYARYNYADKTIEVGLDITGGHDMSNLVNLINTQLASLFSIALETDDTVVAGTYTNGGNGFTDDTGVTASTVTATVAQVRNAIHALSEVDASANASGATVDVITHSAMIGEVNSSETTSSSEPNNRIQITTTGGAANMPIEFRASGASQSFSIEFVNNTRTDGKATGYIELSGGANKAILQIQAVNQGTDYNDVTVELAHHATRKSAVWNPATKTLTVTANTGTDDADDLAALISATGLFTGTVLGSGSATYAGTESTTLRDGAKYDKVIINLATDANGIVTSTAAEVVNAINASTALQSVGITASHVFSSDGSGTAATGTVTLSQLGVTATNAYASGTTYAANGANARITVTAQTAGSAYNGVKIVFEDDATVTAGSNEYATYDSAQKILTFHIDVSGGSTAANVATNFLTGSRTSAAVKALFTVTAGGTGAAAVTVNDVGWLKDGITYGGTSLGAIDSEGNFDAGEVVGTSGLDIKATEYGSNRFVSVKALSGSFTVYDSTGTAKERVSGTDAVARINGITAVADGLNLSVNTSTLDLSFQLNSSVAAGASFSFQIVSGGAQFQLGPEVVSNQQSRMGISSMSTAKLGGSAGQLYQIRSGGTYSISTNTTQAAKIVDQAIAAVATLRGRLGAFQRTTLDTNIKALNDTVEALTNAESSIRDADFAAETANLTRAQILSQSGLSVLAIANSQPQQVLALLRG